MALGIFLANVSALSAALLPAALQVSPGATTHAPGHGSRSPVAFPPVPADQPRPEFWLPDEPIETLCVDGGRLYIGGQFSQVGPYTGPYAVMAASTGLPDLSWPRCDGYVNAVAADGQGGWYVGGLFNHFGGQPRMNLAHVLGNGQVGSLSTVVGEVFALTVEGPLLYVGGSFQTAGGQERDLVAALDPTTGAATGWAPITQHMNTSDRVSKIVVDGDTVYLSGYFDTPTVFPRRNLAAVSASTGSLISTFDPDPDGTVQDLVLSGSTLYAGGWFTHIGGAQRTQVASLDGATGVATGLNPSVVGGVLALALDGTTLYMGGTLTSLGGQARSCGGAIDTVTGTVLPWDPRCAAGNGGSLEIDDLVVGTSEVFAAGSFRSIGGQRQLGVARLDASTGEALTWAGDAAGPSATGVLSLALEGGELACGGHFCILGGDAREGAAALDLATGQLTPWRPHVYGQLNGIQIGNVLEILVSGGTAWLGGQFSYVNGDTRHTLASVDAITGATNAAFDPGFFFSGEFIHSMKLRGNTLFAGGSFHTPDPNQSNLISLDATTGAIVPGSTSAGPTIYQLELSPDESVLYMCGQIAGVGIPSVPRNDLAAIDPTNGSVLPWDPNANDVVSSVRWFGGRIWAAGIFRTIGGQPHGGLASLDPVTGAASSAFSPVLRLNGNAVGADDLVLYDDTLIVGGGFDTVNSVGRNSLAAFEISSGALRSWNPAGATGITRLLLGEGVLAFTGGGIHYPTGEARPFLGVYDAVQ